MPVEATDSSVTSIRGGGRFARTLAHDVARRLAQMGPLHSAVLAGRTLRNQLIDRALNIDTTSLVSSKLAETGVRTYFNDPVHYEATDYALLHRYIRPLNLSADDVVYEIGCGLGRTLCVFARQHIAKCVGIEIDPELFERACANARLLRGRQAQIELHCIDAIEADYNEGTIYWLNNPFGEKTLVVVIDRIRESVRSNPRPIQIAYIYPAHEHVFERGGWLHCFAREKPVLFSTSESSYWTNCT